MAFNLAGRKFLVTGAGRGLGRALSKTLSEQGCKVYAVSKTMKYLETLASESSNIEPIQSDVGNWDELRTKLKDIEVLDGLVNNACYVGEFSGPALDVSKAYLDKVIDVQLLGSINVIQVVGQKMVEAKKPGSIVNVSSVFSLQGVPNNLGYCMTKAGLDMITKQFALELGPHNIRVNSLNPTMFYSDSVKAYLEGGSKFDQVFIDKTPMKRLPEIREVVSPLLYLLSDHSSMVSGTNNIVDGAMMSSFITSA